MILIILGQAIVSSQSVGSTIEGERRQQDVMVWYFSAALDRREYDTEYILRNDINQSCFKQAMPIDPLLSSSLDSEVHYRTLVQEQKCRKLEKK
jgi:hypothetical protein